MSSRWRPLVACAPVLGIVGIVWAGLSGEREILTSRNVYLVLVAVSVLGWWIARRVVRVLSGTPQLPIGQAKPGRVTLKGTAQSLPDRAPLVSTAGRPCVWFHYREKDLRTGGIQTSMSDRKDPKNLLLYESSRPFLIVDDSGKCIVIPAAADITTGNEDESLGYHEFAILPGDTIIVSGEFRPFSGSALPAVDEDDAPVTILKQTRKMLPGMSDIAEFVKEGQRKAEEMEADNAFARKLAAPLPALPTVALPDYDGIFIITTKGLAGDIGIYWLLSYVNLAVLLGAAGMLAHLHLAAR